MSTKNSLELNGNLSRNPFGELLAEIAQMNLFGSLRLSKDQQKIIFYIDSGDVVFAVSNARKHRLFEILLNQNQITKAQLAKVENFTNDFYLSKALIKENLFDKKTINAFFAYQIKTIVASALTFETGEWTFSSLARVKDGIRFDVEINTVLYEFAQKIPLQDILARFKSFDEVFCLTTKKNIDKVSFTPQEAFLISRLTQQNAFSINDLITMSGLPNNDILQILYILWLGGFVTRRNWNSAFSKDEIANINSANVTLKTSATSVEAEQEKILQKKLEEEERLAKLAEKQKAIDEKLKSGKETEMQLSLEEYITRIEDAATHYEIFDVKPNAEISEIKMVYFALAKKFHPDLYHKTVKPELHTKIQHSFTELAQAYETLKDEEAREVYDFKLRKVLEKLKENDDDSSQSLTKDDLQSSNQATMASDNFDRGYDLLMNEEYEEALPHFGRAVHMDGENARYQAFYGKALSFDKNKRHVAETHLQTAVKLDPKNTVYRVMLVELFIEIGLKARAKGELNRLLKIAPNSKEAKSLLDSLNDK